MRLSFPAAFEGLVYLVFYHDFDVPSEDLIGMQTPQLDVLEFNQT